MPLNVLDMEAFKNISDTFDDAPVTVVNEGLLMYLNRSEKEILCANIRETIKRHGGNWIAADIYFRHQMEEQNSPMIHLTNSWRNTAYGRICLLMKRMPETFLNPWGFP